jgi:hypothetical protein
VQPSYQLYVLALEAAAAVTILILQLAVHPHRVITIAALTGPDDDAKMHSEAYVSRRVAR